jgi:hypothetical protein
MPRTPRPLGDKYPPLHDINTFLPIPRRALLVDYYIFTQHSHSLTKPFHIPSRRPYLFLFLYPQQSDNPPFRLALCPRYAKLFIPGTCTTTVGALLATPYTVYSHLYASKQAPCLVLFSPPAPCSSPKMGLASSTSSFFPCQTFSKQSSQDSSGLGCLQFTCTGVSFSLFG